MSVLSIETVLHTGGIAVMGKVGTNAVHYVAKADGDDVKALCGRVLGSTGDEGLDVGTDVTGMHCKRCAGIYRRMLDGQTAEPVKAPEVSAPKLDDAVLDAADVALGDDVAAELDDVTRYVWRTSDVDGADLVAVSAMGDGPGHVYAVQSGGMWHAGDSVPVDRAEFYAQGETPDVAVSILRGKVATVRAAVAPGDVVASTPGNTDRVARALEAARKVAAERNNAETMALLSDVPLRNGAVAQERDANASKSVQERKAAEVKAVARTTDGKCAVELPQEDGTTLLVTLSGRMDMGTAELIAGMVGVEVIPVGKSAGALAPEGGKVSGYAGPQPMGVCAVCHKEVRLTGSGAVGTHRPSGDTPSGPMLTQRSVPVINDKGETPRDAEKKRDAEAYVDELAVTVDDMAPAAQVAAAVLAAVTGDKDAPGVKEVRTPVVPEALSGKAPVGVRDHGRGDGVAMIPLGTTGYAGVKFDDGGTFDLDGNAAPAKGVLVSDIVGGAFGDLTEAEYGSLSKSAKRAYRRKIAKRQAEFYAGRDAARKKRAAQEAAVLERIAKLAGTRELPEGLKMREAELRRRAKKGAVLKSGAEGQTASHHLDARPQDVTVFGADGKSRIGRDHV